MTAPGSHLNRPYVLPSEGGKEVPPGRIICLSATDTDIFEHAGEELKVRQLDCVYSPKD